MDDDDVGEDPYQSMWTQFTDQSPPINARRNDSWQLLDEGDQPNADLTAIPEPHRGTPSPSILANGSASLSDRFRPRAITPFDLGDLGDDDDIQLGWQSPPRHMGNTFSHATTQTNTNTRYSNHSPQPPRPRADHSDDWLDRPARGRQSSFGYVPDNLFFDTHSEQSISQSQSPVRTSPGPRTGDLNELRERRESMTMPPAIRRVLRTPAAIVDLTASSPEEQRQPRSLKRAAEETCGQAPKRPKTGDGDEVEEVNLTDPQELARQKEREQAIQAQQWQAEGPQKLGQITCIICLEEMTNITITHCGHIMCHECLIQALIASERAADRNTGACPACRKPVSRRKAGNIIPLALMKTTAYKGKARANAAG